MKKLYFLFMYSSILKYPALTYIRMDLVRFSCLGIALFYKRQVFLDRAINKRYEKQAGYWLVLPAVQKLKKKAGCVVRIIIGAMRCSFKFYFVVLQRLLQSNLFG
jgi:hypothetical protein